MNTEHLKQVIENVLRESAENRVEPAGEPIPIFDGAVIGCTAASDPLFCTFKQPDVIGAHFRLPNEWLQGAKGVISFFLPFSQHVRASNARQTDTPSHAWLVGRVEGQACLETVSRALAQALGQAGYSAVVPVLSHAFWTVFKPETPDGRAFTSNWSERHVAYACGLGTFGLSKGLITERGMAGRFGSVVTDWPAPQAERPYQGIYDYCTQCGACAQRCPGNAISVQTGKDHDKCFRYQAGIRELCAPRYGCGLCQTGTPCESCIPPKR